MNAIHVYTLQAGTMSQSIVRSYAFGPAYRNIAAHTTLANRRAVTGLSTTTNNASANSSPTHAGIAAIDSVYMTAIVLLVCKHAPTYTRSTPELCILLARFYHIFQTSQLQPYTQRHFGLMYELLHVRTCMLSRHVIHN